MSTPDELDQANHIGHATYAAELAQPADDLPAGVPGNDEYVPEYLPPQRQQQQRQAEPQHQQQAPQEQRQQPRHPSYREAPSQDDDPIGHFDARQSNLEAWAHQTQAHNQGKAAWENLVKSEDAMRADLDPEDYDNATDHLRTSREQELAYMYPDGNHEVAVAAYRAGFASPAHLRAAVLQNDIAQVSQHAQRNGLTPAQAFYSLAMQRGYRPTTIATRSHMKQVLKEIDHVDDKTFDNWWDRYAHIAKQRDEEAKGK